MVCDGAQKHLDADDKVLQACCDGLLGVVDPLGVFLRPPVRSPIRLNETISMGIGVASV